MKCFQLSQGKNIPIKVVLIISTAQQFHFIVMCFVIYIFPLIQEKANFEMLVFQNQHLMRVNGKVTAGVALFPFSKPSL